MGLMDVLNGMQHGPRWHLTQQREQRRDVSNQHGADPALSL